MLHADGIKSVFVLGFMSWDSLLLQKLLPNCSAYLKVKTNEYGSFCSKDFKEN